MTICGAIGDGLTGDVVGSGETDEGASELIEGDVSEEVSDSLVYIIVAVLVVVAVLVIVKLFYFLRRK